MKYLVSWSLVVISFYAHAQYPDRNQGFDGGEHKFVPKEITIKLSPIVLERGRYFYDGRRVTFEEVVLPLISTNDAIIDRRLRVVRTLMDVRKGLRYAQFAYWLIIVRSAAYNFSSASYSTLLVSAVGIFVFDELYGLAIALAKKKTIDRYNDVILQPSFSLGQYGGAAVGLTFRF